jgi:hypothetical protein
LRNEVQAFLEEEAAFDELSDEEWRQVDYLVEILFPFCVWTNLVGRTREGPTIHDSFKIYNILFDHLESQIPKLRPKRKSPWKVQLRKPTIGINNSSRQHLKRLSIVGFLRLALKS